MQTQKTLRSVDELIDAGLAPATARTALQQVAARYAVAITPEMAMLAAREPAIAAQFVPQADEMIALPEERADPIGDAAHSPVKGIVHRYADRVLLKLTHVCPVYCRFCFRREMVGPEGHGALDAAELDAALAYVRRTPAITEVIVTGGDPFVLNARRIRGVTEAIASLGHVRSIRWHTRVPVVQPDAISREFVAALTATGLTVRVAVHANHPAEFTEEASAAIARLADAGIGLLSQTVLLKGVNADVDTLEALMQTFTANRIAPYYLHHGDLAPGTSHFRTGVAEGLAIVAALRQRLPADAMPAYVLDIPGGFGKVPMANARRAGEHWAIDDREGRTHAYP